MPSPKIHRKGGGQEKNKKVMRLSSEKASSFHARGDGVVAAEMLWRPRTAPDLFFGRSSSAEDVVAPPKLTKLLLNVTIHRCLGAVRVMLPPEATVEDLIAAALRQYAKEARLPVINPTGDASGFDLHFSQFSLESKKLIGSISGTKFRFNFFYYYLI